MFNSLNPTFAAIRGILFLMNFFHMRDAIDPTMDDPFKWWGLGISLFYLAMHAAFFSLLVLIIDFSPDFIGLLRLLTRSKQVQAISSIDDEDSDVADERRRIETQAIGTTDAICIRNLRKEWKNGAVAVDNLCLGINSGECFGLLGENGAG